MTCTYCFAATVSIRAATGDPTATMRCTTHAESTQAATIPPDESSTLVPKSTQ